MANMQAGWFTDPFDSTKLRWWDGSSWSDNVSRGGAVWRGAATLGIRPEDLGIGSDGTAIAECEVQFVEQLGSEALIYLRSAIAEQPVIVAKSDGSCQVARGARVTLRVDPARCHLFDASDRAIGSPP